MTRNLETNGKNSLAGEKLTLFKRIVNLLSQSNEDVLIREDGELIKYDSVEYFRQPAGVERFKYFDEAAAFCEVVYADNEQHTAQVINKNGKIKHWPGWVQIDANQFAQRPKLQSGWLNFDKDLKIQVWVNQKDKQAMIVFRGTTSARDWFTNLRWLTVVPFRALARLFGVNRMGWLRQFFPQINDHYDIAKRYVPKLACGLEQKYGRIEISAAGHSLGGGLAQLAAYSSQSIKTVFAFNPSPVAGYFCVPRVERIKNQKGVYIARAYEKGEVLAFARLLVRPFKRLVTIFGSRDGLEIEELRFNFVADDTLTEHKMAPLRIGLENIYGTA